MMRLLSQGEADELVRPLRLKTGERRIIEFFLSPFLKYQDEALRER